MLEKIDDFSSCALGYTISIIKGKWEPYIIWYLSFMPDHRACYSKLRQGIPYSISHKMFIQHLTKLEEAGVVERIVLTEKPLRVDYALTRKGCSLANILYFLRDWGAVYGDFSEDVLKRTKGVVGDGFVSYAANDDGVPHEKDGLVWRIEYPVPLWKSKENDTSSEADTGENLVGPDCGEDK